MTHRRIQEYLPDFAAGVLTSELTTEVRIHLEACRDCTEWLDTYRALAAAGSNVSTEMAPHPSSDTLARFAVVPESLDAEVKATVTAHLEQCSQCDQEAHLCRRAVAGASAPETIQVAKGSEVRAASSDVYLAHGPLRGWIDALRLKTSGQMLIAACVLLSVLGGGTILLILRATPETFTLTRRNLSGNTTIEARGTIEATSSSVDPGANVTLRAKQVVLGAGFTVENGARLTIESLKE